PGRSLAVVEIDGDCGLRGTRPVLKLGRPLLTGVGVGEADGAAPVGAEPRMPLARCDSGARDGADGEACAVDWLRRRGERELDRRVDFGWSTRWRDRAAA